MVAFGLGAIGIALLVAWVVESLLNKNVKLLAIGFAVALIPLFCWQAYIASAVSGLTDIQPAYDDQQVYNFYNGSYAKNMFTFKDPFSLMPGFPKI
jgi:hypothetical protein